MPASLAIRPEAAKIILRIAMAPLPPGVSEAQRDYTLQNLQALAVKPEDANRIVPNFLQPDWGPEANGIGRELQAMGIGSQGVSTGADPDTSRMPLWPARVQMVVQTIMSALQQTTSADNWSENAWLQQELGALIARPTVRNLRLSIGRLLEPGTGRQAHRMATQLQTLLTGAPAA
jgi:hypothetical protein